MLSEVHGRFVRYCKFLTVHSSKKVALLHFRKIFNQPVVISTDLITMPALTNAKPNHLEEHVVSIANKDIRYNISFKTNNIRIIVVPLFLSF